MNFSQRNQQFGRILKAECRRLHITRDDIVKVARMDTHLESAVRHG